jgi:hypothetical protein
MLITLMCFGLLLLKPLCFGNEIRVGCLKGKPPFVDVNQQGQCVGLMADIFTAITENGPLAAYNISTSIINSTVLSSMAKGRPICPDSSMDTPNCIISKSDIPSILYHTTDRPKYDIGITFTYATNDRLKFMDTSIPIMQTYYTFMLTNSHCPSGSDFVATLIRQSVMYLFAGSSRS